MELKIIPVVCKPGCVGDLYPCIDQIKKIVESGNVAFMIYSHHVMEKISEMDFKIEIMKQNGMPLAVYISAKGERSVYERFGKKSDIH
jgi:hypothetical protein